jgi:hypothetical protein
MTAVACPAALIVPVLDGRAGSGEGLWSWGQPRSFAFWPEPHSEGGPISWRAAIAFAVSESGPGGATKTASR